MIYLISNNKNFTVRICNVNNNQLTGTKHSRMRASGIATINTDAVSLLQGHGLMTIDALLKARCSLQASSIVLLLSNDKYDMNYPIVEAAAQNLNLELSGQPDAQQLTSSCALKLHVDVYNHQMMGWEPLIEPWASSVALAMPLTR